MVSKTDIIVIGAGAVGLATARELSRRYPQKKILLLEKNETYGMETSRFNSGVIHSGLHLNPKFLKAKFAREGGKLVIDLCKEKSVPHRKCGMVIVGVMPRPKEIFSVFGQLLALWHLWRRAKAQGIKIKLLNGRGVRRLHPAIKAFIGIYVDEVYMIDPLAYVTALASDLGANVEWRVKSPVAEINKGVSSYFVKIGNSAKPIALAKDPTASPDLPYSTQYDNPDDVVFEAPVVINAAGLGSRAVAKMAGHEYETYFYSGEYYRVTPPEKRALIGDTLVYPAIVPGKPGLGIHITKKMDGHVYLGPNAVLRADPWIPEGQTTGPELFADAVKPFWPGIEAGDLEWAYAGIRPKAVLKGEGDFIIVKESEHPVFIDLIGIESPGLTASLAIGNYVAGMIEKG